MQRDIGATPTELARELGIPDPAIGAIMTQLRHLGLKPIAEASDGQPGRYSLAQAKQLFAQLQHRAHSAYRPAPRQTPTAPKPVVKPVVESKESTPQQNSTTEETHTGAVTLAQASRLLKVSSKTLVLVVKRSQLEPVGSSQPATYTLEDLREAVSEYKGGVSPERSSRCAELVSTGELAEQFGKSRRTMRQYLRWHGILPARTIAGEDYFDKQQVMRQMARIEHDKQRSAEELAAIRGLVTAKMLAEETGLSLAVVQWRLGPVKPMLHHKRAALYKRSECLKALANSLHPDVETLDLVSKHELAEEFGLPALRVYQILRRAGIAPVHGQGNQPRYYAGRPARSAIRQALGTTQEE